MLWYDPFTSCMGPSFHRKIFQQLGTVWLPRAEQVLQRPGHDLVFVAAPWGQQPNQEWHCSWPKPNLLACQLLEWSIPLERLTPRFALNGQHEYLSIFPNYFSLVKMQQNQKKTWIFQGVLNGWCLGCLCTILRVQTAPFGKCWYATTTYGYLWYLNLYQHNHWYFGDKWLDEQLIPWCFARLLSPWTLENTQS